VARLTELTSFRSIIGSEFYARDHTFVLWHYERSCTYLFGVRLPSLLFSSVPQSFEYYFYLFRALLFTSSIEAS
jgi:hypothetical protein